MLQSVQNFLWTLATLSDTGVRSPKLLQKELEQTKEIVESLSAALSEMVYVGIYTPKLSFINKLALEKNEFFADLISTEEKLHSNKRKLDLMIAETTRPEISVEEAKRSRKRLCLQCSECGHLKSEKCFSSSSRELMPLCLSCNRRLRFPRIVANL